MTVLSLQIKNPTSSVEQLQFRLDEAAMNKKANEHMETADKMPRKTRTRLRFRDRVSASLGSGSKSGSWTSSSSGWSNTSPRGHAADRSQAEAVTAEPQETSGAIVSRTSLRKDKPASGSRDLVVNRTAPDRDDGEYYIRIYRRESRTSSGEVQIIQVRDYVHWPPAERKSRTAK